MKCETVNELLPWYLNGSLSPEEREGLSEHLAGCEACRRELEQTRLAAHVYLAHPSAEALVDHAYGRPVAGLSSAEIDEHAAFCPTCTEELALIRQSRAHLEAEEAATSAPAPTAPETAPQEAKVIPGPWQRVSTWRWASLAAGLGFTVMTSSYVFNQQRAVALLAQYERRVTEEQNKTAEHERELGELQRQLETLQAGSLPKILPGATPVSGRFEGVMRGEEPGAEPRADGPGEPLVRRPGYTPVVLDLPGGASETARYRIVVREASGVASEQTLAADGSGLWLLLPTGQLALGRLEIDLYLENGRDRLYQYVFEVKDP